MSFMRSTSSFSWIWITLALIFTAGTYLRFANLGIASFWVDEMNHVAAAISLNAGKGAVFPSGLPYDRSMLFTVLVSWSFALFGVTEQAARMPAALFGSLSIVLMFFVGWRMFGRSMYGLTAAAIYAFHPFMIGWARECRMYSMFQFFFLFGVYALYEGFEGTREKHDRVYPNPGIMRRFAIAWNLDGLWIAISAGMLAFAAALHILAGVVFPAAVAYAAIMLLLLTVSEGGLAAWRSKYLSCIALSLATLAAIAVLLPGFFQHVRDGLAFAPNWAKYAHLQSKSYYIDFISDSFNWTIAAFFVIGATLLMVRLQKAGLYLITLFILPLAMLSTLFALRVERYIYHIYPMLLLVVAYGVGSFAYLLRVQLGQHLLLRYEESRLSKAVVLRSVMLLFILVFFAVSPWFRFSRKIPNLAHGTNGAVTHLEWRDAAEFVKGQLKNDEAVISTLPLTVQFYAGRADYFLANTGIDRGDEIFASEDGPRDYYSNARVLDSEEDLLRVMQQFPRGYLVLDKYRLERERYVRPQTEAWIRSQLKPIYTSPGQTVVVYGWG